MYLNRTICDVLEEMRSCIKTMNFSYLMGLVEEIQSMGNRMEATLSDKHDFENLHARKKELSKEVKLLEQKIKELMEANNEKTK